MTRVYQKYDFIVQVIVILRIMHNENIGSFK